MGGSGLTAKAPAKDPPEEDEVTDGGGVGGWFSFEDALRGE